MRDWIIPGATNTTLVLTNLQAIHQGGYSLAASNQLGSVTSATATVTALRPTPWFHPVATGFTNGGFCMSLSGFSGHGDVIIHASTNLVDWEAILTHPPLVGTLQYLDSATTNQPQRFYRAEEK